MSANDSASQKPRKMWFQKGGGGALAPQQPQSSAAGSAKPRWNASGAKGGPAKTGDNVRVVKAGGQQRNKNNKAAASEPEEEYVVFIKNVENDIALIHQHALPAFLCLNTVPKVVPNPTKTEECEGDNDETGEVAAAEAEPAASGAPKVTISCRNETRSAQISIAGDEPMAAFNSRRERPPTNGNGKRGRGDAAGSGGADGAETAANALSSPPPPPPMSSITEVATKFSQRPYFGQRIRLFASSKPGELSQADLVACVATTSKPLSPKDFKKALDGVPGFNAAWRIRAQNFKIVFNNKKALFAAKSLLDEFEADGGVRITVQVPENLAREFQEHVENAGNAQQFV